MKLKLRWSDNTTEGVLYQKLFAIYDHAAPEAWNTNSPVSALQTQFTNHGVGAAWTNQATRNGVDR